MSNDKKPSSKPLATTIYDQQAGGHRLIIRVDRFNWTVTHHETKNANPGDPEYYSNFVSMLNSLFQHNIKAHLKSLDLENLIKVVKEAEAAVLSVAGIIADELRGNPVLTPDRAAQEARQAEQQKKGS